MYVNIESKQTANASQPIRFIAGWLELRSLGDSWIRYWCVLINDVIILYNNERESRTSCVGKIALSPGTKFVKDDGTGDQESGYKFNLTTKRRLNTFKAPKFTDRELWKAYVEGITLGEVSKDIDLLPGQIEDIRSLLKQFHSNGKGYSTSFQLYNNGQDNCTSFQDSEQTTLTDGFDTPDSSTSGSYNQGCDGYLVPVQRRGSTVDTSQKHRFFSDTSRKDIPSWFFFECSRELAVKVLTLGARYGNTLMRERTSDKQLVISKRMETASNDFTHYEIVQLTPQGYRVDVENHHEPMKTLSEVMEFFVNTSGRMTTHPMKCNDLQVLGIENSPYSDYTKQIVPTHKDADSGEESTIDFIAPLNPHLQKPVRQHNTMGPHGQWNSRSMSVPNISSQEVEQVQATQAARLAQLQVSSVSKGSQSSHIMRTHMVDRQGGSHQPAYFLDMVSASTLPRAMQKSSASSKEIPPPLPPNHPPPLTKAHSQSGMIIVPDNSETNVKKSGPKHTQSVSSADMQVRKTSPRDKQSASQAKEDLAQAAARITKNKEILESSNSPEYVIKEKEVIKSPKHSFIKELEKKLANPSTPGSRNRTHIVPENDCDENIAHYQNASEIQIARK